MRSCYSLRQAIEDAAAVGHWGHYKEVAENVFTVPAARYGFGSASREMLEQLPGSLITTERGLTHMNGRGGAKGYVILSGNLLSIQNAQVIHRELLGTEAKTRWTISGMARDMLGVIAPESYNINDEVILPEGLWHYQETYPGLYDYAELCDCTAFYHTILSRIRSPRVRYTGDKRRPLAYDILSDEETALWYNMLSLVSFNHGLRNTLVGCMKGSKGVTWVYGHRGGRVERWPLPKQYGPFRAAGKLVVALGREIIYQQGLTIASIYANIDCVTSVTPSPKLAVFDRYGLKYGVKAFGDAEICHSGSWRIGTEFTKPYSHGEREYIVKERPNNPGVHWLKHWD